MKITTQILSITIALILGFSLPVLSNSNLQKIDEQVMSGDSIKLISKELLANNSQRTNNVKTQKSVFDQLSMNSDDILHIKLTTDVQNLVANKNTDDYQIAYLEMESNNGEKINHKLKVKPRGKYRRKVCDFPPLKLNFSKEELLKQGLHPKFDKLKLVTHCTDNQVEAKDNVLREFLTYQMYNILADNSFRTQLVKIEYADIHNLSKPITRWGFLIEDKDEMASRLNGELCDCRGLESDRIVKDQYNTMTMFQYMIGNEDWDLLSLRNVKVVQLSNASTANNIIVPYDFDFSGVVDAAYAKPNVELKHSSVKQRHFYGNFANASELEVVSNHFLTKRKEILQLVRKFRRLNADAKIDIEVYLEEFFYTLKNKNKASEIFLEQDSYRFEEKIVR
jgi:hypothetical protein